MESAANEKRSEDFALAHRCLEGEAPALEELRQELHSLTPKLVQRGASESEAEDLLQALWADCVSERGDRPPLLEVFNGKCSLRNWLLTIATHRLYDLLRRHKFRGDLPSYDDEKGPVDRFDTLPAAADSTMESGLTELLCDVLRQAFQGCPSEELLMLRLVYLHGLSQRDLCQMWGVSEATISRRLTHTLELLQTRVIADLQSRDAGLKLSWSDLEQLCQTQQLAFL